MDKAINEFREQHALLLTEIKRFDDEETHDMHAARGKELRSILKVVARSFLRERVDPELSEDQLQAWLSRLEAA